LKVKSKKWIVRGYFSEDETATNAYYEVEAKTEAEAERAAKEAEREANRILREANENERRARRAAEDEVAKLKLALERARRSKR
jgi:uncharacterized membrane protein YqiK